MLSKKKKATSNNKLDGCCAPQWVDFFASPKMASGDSYFDVDHTIHQPQHIFSPEINDTSPSILSSTPYVYDSTTIKLKCESKTPFVRQPLQPVRIRALEKMMDILNSPNTINQTILEKNSKSSVKKNCKTVASNVNCNQTKLNSTNKVIQKSNKVVNNEKRVNNRIFEVKKRTDKMKINNLNKENEMQNQNPKFIKKQNDSLIRQKKMSLATHIFKVPTLEPLENHRLKKDKSYKEKTSSPKNEYKLFKREPKKEWGSHVGARLGISKSNSQCSKVPKNLITLPSDHELSNNISEEDLEKTLCPEFIVPRQNIPSNNLKELKAQNTHVKNLNDVKFQIPGESLKSRYKKDSKTLQPDNALGKKNTKSISHCIKSKRVESKSSSEKYISLAEAIDKFQHDIPTKFRKTNLRNPILEMNKQCARLTLAVSPKLKSKTRIRPSKEISQKERELKEFNEAQRHQIKANSIPKKILGNYNPIKKKEKKPITIPQPFNFTQVKKKSHLQDQNSMVPSNNNHVLKNQKVTSTRQKESFKTASLSFEERNRRLWEKKQQFWKNNIQEVDSVYTFHARPAPKFKPIVVKGISQKIKKNQKP